MTGFADPAALLLLALPMLIRALMAPRQAQGDALYLPPAIAGKVEPGRADERLVRLMRWTPALIWGLLVLALAGPRQIETLDIVPASGRDIMLVIDLSGSMKNKDFDLDGERISRLTAVKQVASEFVARRAGDRVGLVVFGSKAYVAAPLTHHVASVSRAIEEAVIGLSGKSTAISDGLGLALRRLERSDAKTRVAVLLSDGVDTTGTVAPDDAAAMAQTMGIRIHTIALGPNDLETTPTTRDAVDSATLRTVAERSGGEMFRVHNMSELRAMAEAIDALEPSPHSAPPLQVWRDYWIWPAALGLGLGIALLLLGRRTLA